MTEGQKAGYPELKPYDMSLWGAISVYGVWHFDPAHWGLYDLFLSMLLWVTGYGIINSCKMDDSYDFMLLKIMNSIQKMHFYSKMYQFLDYNRNACIIEKV